MSSPIPPLDRFRGCLLFGAMGDALGYPVEFLNSAAIRARFGDVAPASLVLVPHDDVALVSDDTQMTLFTAEALIGAVDAASIKVECLRAYQRWFSTQAMRPKGTAPRVPLSATGTLCGDIRLHVRRAPGSTCLAALQQSFLRGQMSTVDDPPNGSKGCGAIMRSAPFGLVAPSRQEAFRHALDAAVLTHGHPSGYFSAAAFAVLVFDLARDVHLQAALDEVDALLRPYEDASETRAALAQGRALGARGKVSSTEIEHLGGGWVGEEALAIAVACVLSRDGESIATTLWRSVFHGGDSDSTGSLVGNLLGAMEGTARIPPGWFAALEIGDVVDRIATALHAHAEVVFPPTPTVRRRD